MHTRRLAVLVLSLALIAPWGASAAGPEPEPASALWSWLIALWAEAGCRLDPSGCADDQGDNGCRIDPSGCTTEEPSPDAGCRADPNGAACATL